MVLDVLDAALELERSVLTGTAPAVGPDPDQAAVDAEFAAIVLAEAPWGASEAAPVAAPGATATITRLAPWRPRGHRDRAGGRTLGRAGVREPGRRPRSVARSPPPSRSIDRWH